VLQMLLSTGAVDARTQCLLPAAASAGDASALHCLLEHGADAASQGGVSALWEAAHGGYVECAAALLEAGAPPDEMAVYDHKQVWDGMSAAALPALVPLLLEHGGGRHIRSSSADSAALTTAAACGHFSALWLLIPLYDGRQAYCAAVAACRNRQLTALRMLLNTGAVDASTPGLLHAAVASGWAPAVRCLLAHGADATALASSFSVQYGPDPEPPARAARHRFGAAAAAAPVGHDVLGIRLRHDEPPHPAYNIRSVESFTPLHYLAGTPEECEAVAGLLLDANAELEAPSYPVYNNMTPLLKAIDSGHGYAALELLRRGATPFDQPGGPVIPGGNSSALHRIAAIADHEEMGVVIAALLAAGVGVNTSSARDGQTPLHAAATRGCLAAISALLAAGANPRARDHAGLTPLQLSRRQHQTPSRDVAIALSVLAAAEVQR
jgi:ankyrin repeat protein